jgi:hypothetical protein
MRGTCCACRAAKWHRLTLQPLMGKTALERAMHL